LKIVGSPEAEHYNELRALAIALGLTRVSVEGSVYGEASVLLRKYRLRLAGVPVVSRRGGDRAVLTETGQWRPPVGVWADAAHLFLETMFQPVGPGGGRAGLRLARDAPLCRHRLWAASRCPTR